jgi:hypothetical protein
VIIQYSASPWAVNFLGTSGVALQFAQNHYNTTNHAYRDLSRGALTRTSTLSPSGMDSSAANYSSWSGGYPQPLPPPEHQRYYDPTNAMAAVNPSMYYSSDFAPHPMMYSQYYGMAHHQVPQQPYYPDPSYGQNVRSCVLFFLEILTFRLGKL